MGNCCGGGGGTRTSDVRVKESGAVMESASPTHPGTDGRVAETVQLEPHNGTGQEEETDEVEVTALQHIADREGTTHHVLVHAQLLRLSLPPCGCIGPAALLV